MVPVKEVILYCLPTNSTNLVQYLGNQIRYIGWLHRRLTFAAETLSFPDGSDTAYSINQLAQKAGLVKSPSPIFRYTDSRLLHDSANTTA